MVAALAAPRLNAPHWQQLENGLTIIAERLPVPAVTFDLWVKIGSVVEPDAINGVAHFLEHMVFKGSQRLKAGEFEQQVEARGAIANAATSQDYTHFYFTCAPHDFADLVSLQTDVVLHPLLAEAEFERERRVVLEEIRRAEDNPRRRAYYRMMEASFERLPYRRPVLGPYETIAQLQLTDLQAFHRQWYGANQLVAVVVGDLPEAEMIDAVRAAMADHAPVVSQRSPLLPEPAFSQPQQITYHDADLHQARLYLTWRVPGLNQLSRTYALDAIASILASGRTSRLVAQLREQQGLVSNIVASNSTYRDQGLFAISARLPVAHLETVRTQIFAELQELQNEGVTTAELEKIRRQVVNRFIFGNERPSDRASLYGYYGTLLGSLEPAFDYVDEIHALSTEDLQLAVQTYLDPQACATIQILPGEHG
ncbi:pitrilysin family protein [Synechococcus elongatus IITB4]|uniref:M16 family metallopeptidase n=1 Tax=Synechococcus elongatus TaxID=32046 RepID=UPI0030CFBCB6